MKIVLGGGDEGGVVVCHACVWWGVCEWSQGKRSQGKKLRVGVAVTAGDRDDEALKPESQRKRHSASVIY